MSNLLKSKFLLGVMVVAVMFVGVVAVKATPAAAETCSITTTLRVGSRGEQVKCLQSALSLVADGAFGPKTKAAVVAWQKSMGLVADGIFGAKSRAAWSGGPVVGNLPAGCTSTSGFSPLTGVPCSSSVGTLPAGCSSTSGFSATTGVPCSGTTTQTGPVTVSLAANNPASSTLVAGQATADLAHFTFVGNGTVTGVTLQRLGVSSDSTPSNVYLFDGATRLTDAASISNNGKVSFSVPAGIFTVSGSKTISVKSDIAASTSGQTVGMMLATFTTANGTVTANLSGNIHSIASATLAAVTAGTVTPSGATINPAANVTVWQSTLSISNRDVWMKRLALRNVGSAPASSFQNFKLYVNGVQVGTAAGLDINGYVTFDLNSAPVLLVSGSRVVRVDVDVVSGASRTVQFSLRQAADVDFVDSSFGVNITPALTGNALPWTGSASTISGATGGSLTVEKDVSSPSTNLTLNGNDVNLGTFKLTAYGESIKLETLKAGFTYADNSAGTNSAATLRNGRILIGTAGNMVPYGSTATLVPAGTSFTTNYTIVPGTPVLVEVHADVYDNDGLELRGILALDTIKATLVLGANNAQRVDSLGSFNAPLANVDANTLTVATTAMTLSKNSTYANQTTSLPATNFKIGSYNLAGSSVEDILLTTLSIDVAAAVGAGFDAGDVKNLYPVVKYSGGQISPAPIGTVVAADNNFSINYTLKKNENVTVELYANLADDSTGTIDATDAIKTVLMVSGTSMVSGQTVTGGDGSTTVAGQNVAYAVASLTVSKDASSPVTAIVYDNQTVTTLAAKFVALTANYNVTDLTLTFGADSGTVISEVQLWDGSTKFAYGPMTTATTAVFSNLAWNVPANLSAGKVLTVKVVVGEIGVGNGTSGAVITTSIAANTDFTATNTSTGVSAVGAGTAVGSAMYAYASLPTISLVSLPSTVLGTGTQTIAKFSVASNGGNIEWKKMIFAVDRVIGGTDTLTLASTYVYDVTDGNTVLVPGAVTASGSIEADNGTTGTLIFIATDPVQVSGTKTYVLKTTVNGTLAAADHINVSITSPNSYVAPATYTTVAAASGATNTFVWSDVSASAHDTTSSLDWNNANLVKNLPTDTQTLTSPL